MEKEKKNENENEITQYLRISSVHAWAQYHATTSDTFTRPLNNYSINIFNIFIIIQTITDVCKTNDVIYEFVAIWPLNMGFDVLYLAYIVVSQEAAAARMCL